MIRRFALISILFVSFPCAAHPLNKDLLNAASKSNSLGEVQSLLRRGADPNAHDVYGVTVLMKAAEIYNVPVVDALLQHGARVNLRDRYGFTVLGHNALPPITTLCLKYGAKASPSDSGVLADVIETFLGGGNGDEDQIKAMIKEFLHLGMDLNHRGYDEAKSTPLIGAVDYPDGTFVNYLLERGADPNLADKDGVTPLLAALGPISRSEAEDLAVVTTLLKAGAKVNVHDAEGNTPLIKAVEYGRITIARILINRGANVNTPGKDEITPLMAAARGSHLELAELLLEAGATPSVRDPRGRTALDFAHEDVVLYGQNLPDVPDSVKEKATPEERMVIAMIEQRIRIIRLLEPITPRP